MVFGTIAIIDLRLLGLASTKRSYTELARELLPWTWGAFFVSAACGAILILSRPAGYFENADFRLKFVCMGLAFVNMLVFQLITSKSVSKWDPARRRQGRGRAVAPVLDRCRLFRPHDRLHHGAGRRLAVIGGT
jgi:hypothetical protein